MIDSASDDDDLPLPLSIGVVTGGPGRITAAWGEEIRRLQQVVAELRPVSAPFNLNVVFLVPGTVWQPDFAGVRTGKFDKTAPELMVQVAVPDVEVAEAAMRQALLDWLGEAVDAAETFAQKRGVAQDLDVQRQVVEQVAAVT